MGQNKQKNKHAFKKNGCETERGENGEVKERAGERGRGGENNRLRKSNDARRRRRGTDYRHPPSVLSLYSITLSQTFEGTLSHSSRRFVH